MVAARTGRGDYPRMPRGVCASERGIDPGSDRWSQVEGRVRRCSALTTQVGRHTLVARTIRLREGCVARDEIAPGEGRVTGIGSPRAVARYATGVEASRRAQRASSGLGGWVEGFEEDAKPGETAT